MAHGFRLLISHDRSRYMVLQPHPHAPVCLTCVGGHSFSHSMITHEPFVRFDELLDFFLCGLG
jgi:hypothetical protein